MPPRALSIGLACAFGSACLQSLDSESVDGAELTCNSDADCLDGFTCQTAVSRCVATSQPDRDAPRLVAAVATSENVLELTFSEPVVLQRESTVFTVTGLAVRSTAPVGDTQIVLTTDTQVPGNTYTVTAERLVDLSGNLIDSSASSLSFVGFGLVPDQTPPDLVTPLDLEVVRGQRASLSWSARLGATRYEVQVSTSPDFASQVEGSPFRVDAGDPPVGLPPTSLMLQELPPEQTIYWRVRADVTAPAEGSTDPWSLVSARSFELLGDAVHVFCAPPPEDCSPQNSDAPTQARVESGNLSTPYRSVDRAIVAAFAQEIPTVRVARRGEGAVYEEAITLLSGVSLLGGFDSTFETRDLSSPTTIRSDGIVATAASISRSFGDTTVLEGVRLEGASDSEQDFSVALAVNNSDGALVVRRSELIGGAARIRSVGLDITNARAGSAPEVIDSVIRSDAASDSFAVSVQQGAVTLRSNTVVAAGAPGGFTSAVTAFSPQAVLVEGSDLRAAIGAQVRTVFVDASGTPNLERFDLIDNSVHAGAASDGCHAVWYESRQAVTVSPGMLVRGNHLSTEDGFRVHAMELRSHRDPIVVENNVIESAPTAREDRANYTLHMNGATNAVFTHNTIVSGDCDSCTYRGVLLAEPQQNPSIRAAAAPVFTNNVFVLRKSGQAVFWELDTAGAPRSIENNLMVLNGGSVFLSTESGAVSFSELGSADIGDPCVGWIQIFNGQCIDFEGTPRQTLRLGGNLESTSTLDALFIDPDGPDDDFTTTDDNDWRFESRVSSRIRSGGKDTSLQTCGTLEMPQSCGDVAEDIDGVARSATPTPGAYEAR
ncbi:MAG: Ig-like domain-containing protein [Myxococcota bacterium]